MRDTKSYLTSIDVGRVLNVTPDRIRQLARAGRLRPTLVLPRGQRLFSAEDVETFRRQRAAEPPEAA
jgi:DNA-binding transcriptional MerR regulator